MKKVINIGRTGKDGRFTNSNWKTLLEWIGEYCDNVLIYTLQNNQQIDYIFSAFTEITEERFPDRCSNYKAYRLRCKDKKMWEVISSADFNIDSGIVTIYFLKGEEYMAELQVDDDENFVVLELSKQEEQELLKAIPVISENVEVCINHKDHVDYLMDDDIWEPLGS